MWYFIQCDFNDDDKPDIKIHNKYGSIIDWGDKPEEGITSIFGIIVGLLKEAERLMIKSKKGPPEKKYSARKKFLE